MKVIDLLNKIANGEEVPEKIKYNEKKYNLNKITGWYQNIDVIGNINEWFISKYRLNDIVEIIEEQQDIDIQKIEEIDEQFSLKYINSGLKKETEKALDDVINNIYIKTNELIQAVKQLDKKIKDKE